MDAECARMTCSREATVLLAYDPRSATAWLRDLVDAHPSLGLALCIDHAERMSVPLGWTKVDERRPAWQSYDDPDPFGGLDELDSLDALTGDETVASPLTEDTLFESDDSIASDAETAVSGASAPVDPATWRDEEEAFGEPVPVGSGAPESTPASAPDFAAIFADDDELDELSRSAESATAEAPAGFIWDFADEIEVEPDRRETGVRASAVDTGETLRRPLSPIATASAASATANEDIYAAADVSFEDIFPPQVNAPEQTPPAPSETGPLVRSRTNRAPDIAHVDIAHVDIVHADIVHTDIAHVEVPHHAIFPDDGIPERDVEQPVASHNLGSSVKDERPQVEHLPGFGPEHVSPALSDAGSSITPSLPMAPGPSRAELPRVEVRPDYLPTRHGNAGMTIDSSAPLLGRAFGFLERE